MEREPPPPLPRQQQTTEENVEAANAHEDGRKASPKSGGYCSLCCLRNAAVRREKRGTFALHAWLHATVGFVSIAILFAYRSLDCRARLAGAVLVRGYGLFSAAQLAGTLANIHVARISNHSKVLLSACCALVFSLLLVTFAYVEPVLLTIFGISGAALGVLQSSILVSFVTRFPQKQFALTHFLHTFHSIGATVAALTFTQIREISGENRRHACPQTQSSLLAMNFSSTTTTTAIADDEYQNAFDRFPLFPRVRLDNLFIGLALLHIPIICLILDSSSAVDETPKEEYEDLDPVKVDATIIKILLIVASMICVSSLLSTLTPFYLLAPIDSGGDQLRELQLFVASSILGRALWVAPGNRMVPYVTIGLCILGTGFASCCLAVEGAPRLVGISLFGSFSSALLPSVIVYVRFSLGLAVPVIHVLLVAHSIAGILHPVMLAHGAWLDASPRLYVVAMLAATLLLVGLFVALLNAQTSLTRTRGTAEPQDTVKIYIDRFLSGENVLHRARSIKPMFRHLRQASIRRFREATGSVSTGGGGGGNPGNNPANGHPLAAHAEEDERPTSSRSQNSYRSTSSRTTTSGVYGTSPRASRATPSDDETMMIRVKRSRRSPSPRHCGGGSSSNAGRVSPTSPLPRIKVTAAVENPPPPPIINTQVIARKSLEHSISEDPEPEQV